MATTNIQSFAGQVEVNSNLSVNTNTLHVDSVSGRVGIGKTDPGYAMDVNGTVNATDLYLNGSDFVSGLWTPNGSDIYYTTGVVGIGTATTPQKTLEVAGPVRITDGGSAVCDISVELGSFEYQSKITAPGTVAGDSFGKAVSMSADTSYAIIGSDYHNSVVGAAWIFSRAGSTWTLQQKITAPDAGAHDHFGKAVSISSDGSYALVGANEDTLGPQPPNVRQGSAYIFNRVGTSWSYQSKITAPDAEFIDTFGTSVSISGDGFYAIAGSPGEDDGGAQAGAAYIYVRSGSTWTFQQKITAPDADAYDRFGLPVSLSSDGTYAVAGSYGDDDTNPNSGAAYIFVRSGTSWTHQQKIKAPDVGPGDGGYGQAIAISADASYVAMGVSRRDGPAGGPERDWGATYIFNRSGTSWTHQQKILTPDRYRDDLFGVGVSLSSDGSSVLVGCQRDDDISTDSGAAYIFTRSGTTWSYQSKIKAPDAVRDDNFGYSVSISGDGSYALVGAYGDELFLGSAYTYSLPLTVNVSLPITADGTLLSFTGQHICFPEGPMGQGLIVSANKNKYVSLNGSLTTGNRAIKSSEALPVVSLSNVASDPSVFGVVDHFEQSGTTRSQKSGATVITQDKESGDNRVVVNSLGEGAIWVANTNGNVVSGDFLTTSHLPGYAQRQSDNDTLLNYTVAKSTMDCDFEPEELPVQVILKDDDDNNVLDSYGRLQWVDSDRTEPEYIIRYLDVSGTPTDEANAVHKAAYVGCTYHCG